MHSKLNVFLQVVSDAGNVTSFADLNIYLNGTDETFNDFGEVFDSAANLLSQSIIKKIDRTNKEE